MARWIQGFFMCTCAHVCVCVCVHVCNLMYTSDFKCRKTSAASTLGPAGKTAMNRHETTITTTAATAASTITTAATIIKKMGRRREKQKQKRLRTKWGCRVNKNSIYDPKNHAPFQQTGTFPNFHTHMLQILNGRYPDQWEGWNVELHGHLALRFNPTRLHTVEFLKDKVSPPLPRNNNNPKIQDQLIRFHGLIPYNMLGIRL